MAGRALVGRHRHLGQIAVDFQQPPILNAGQHAQHVDDPKRECEQQSGAVSVGTRW